MIEEENFVLEVCQNVDVESISELRYSLAAVSSGVSDSCCFNVVYGDDKIAFILYEDDVFKIRLFNNSGYTKNIVTDSIEDAFDKIVSGDVYSSSQDFSEEFSRHETIISIIQKLYMLQNVDFENIQSDHVLESIDIKLKEISELL